MLFRLMEIIGLKLLYPLLLLQTRLQSPTKCRLSCVSKLTESSSLGFMVNFFSFPPNNVRQVKDKSHKLFYVC